MNGYYNEFEKISDVIMILEISNTQESVLKMNTKLGHKNSNGYREPFASGFVVNSNKGYRNPSNYISIKRNFDYYMSIEILRDPDFFVIIRPHNMILIKQKLQEAFINWYNSDDIWLIAPDKMPKVILSKVIPIEIMGLQPDNKVLRFDPIVLVRNGVADKGMRISVSTSANYIDISMDTLMGLIYIFNTFDLYGAAVQQINSLSIYQHPKFIKDLVQMSTSRDQQEYEDQTESEGVTKSVLGRRPKSFFDKQDEIKKLEE